ncbi:MAG: ATP-dependent DNA helicase, partial [Pacificimonas sp.]
MTTLPAPALAAALDGLFVANEAGIRRVDRSEAVRLVTSTPTIVVNAPVVGAKLGYAELSGLDLLELFAFVHPAEFAVPTVSGLAAYLKLEVPDDGAAEARSLLAITHELLGFMGQLDWHQRGGAWGSAQALSRAHWPWALHALTAMGAPPKPERSIFTALPKWEDAAAPSPAKTVTLDRNEVGARLRNLTGPNAETRQGQADYAAAVTRAFDPRETEGAPNIVLAEAGTGIGKTLGYLAPASAWAERADGTVWLSTYTKALQRQLDAETVKLYP